MLVGIAGLHCDAARGGMVFIEDTAIVLPFASAPDEPEDSSLQDAGPSNDASTITSYP